MRKYIFLLALIFSFALVGAGCQKNDTAKNGSASNQRATGAVGQASFMNNDILEDSSVDKLVLGEKISVMGTANGDGSITAQTIIIGDFSKMQMAVKKPENLPEGVEMPADTKGTRISFDGASGERPDVSQFQNMTDEERQKMRDQIGGARVGGGTTGGTGQGMRAGGFAGAGGRNANGEIIDVDESTITLKLADGGSSLIFYSSETAVKKIKETSPQETQSQ